MPRNIEKARLARQVSAFQEPVTERSYLGGLVVTIKAPERDLIFDSERVWRILYFVSFSRVACIWLDSPCMGMEMYRENRRADTREKSLYMNECVCFRRIEVFFLSLAWTLSVWEQEMVHTPFLVYRMMIGFDELCFHVVQCLYLRG